MYICRLIEGSEPAIDLMYNPGLGASLRDVGIKVTEPDTKETWGGRLDNVLVRDDDSKRIMPCSLVIEGSTGQDLIDRVNALKRRLRHAARFRTEGWGDEVFLEFKIDDATHTVRFPVIKGSVDTSQLMKMTNEPNDLIDEVIVVLICEAYWEDDATYTLENYVDNPGFWRGTTPPGDSWAEFDPAANLTLAWETTIYEVMGNSLKQVYVVDAVNDTGVISDVQTVVASTAYYFEARNYRVTGCDTLTAQVYDISNGAIIAASVLTFNGNVDEWVKEESRSRRPLAA